MKKIVLYVGAFLFSIAGYAQQALWGGGDIVSPQINKDNSVTFRILAPKASKVEIEGDFLPAQKIKTPFGEVEAPGRVQLKEGKNGVWEYTRLFFQAKCITIRYMSTILKQPIRATYTRIAILLPLPITS